MSNGTITREPIPGFRLTMSRELFSDFLKQLEKRFWKSYKNGVIKYTCARCGDSPKQAYDITTNNKRILKRLENFADIFKKRNTK